MGGFAAGRRRSSLFAGFKSTTAGPFPLFKFFPPYPLPFFFRGHLTTRCISLPNLFHRFCRIPIITSADHFPPSSFA